MILDKVFGPNIWVIPNGKDNLILIDLPDLGRDEALFGIIRQMNGGVGSKGAT